MICNAGIGFHGPLDETPPAAMRRIVDVNLMGTLLRGRAAMRAFRRQGRGHIIAMSSIVGRRGVGGSGVYAATKAAQIAFIESLRAEFVGTPFHASVVFPVVTVTEFHETIARDFGHAVSGTGPRQTAEQVAAAIVDVHRLAAGRGVSASQGVVARGAERDCAGAGGQSRPEIRAPAEAGRRRS